MGALVSLSSLNMEDKTHRPKRFFNGFLIVGVFLLGLGTGSQIIGDSDRKLSKPALQELIPIQFSIVENDYVDDTEQQKSFWCY